MESLSNGGGTHNAGTINLPGVYWWESYALILFLEQRKQKQAANIKSDMECDSNVIATNILNFAKHTGQAIEKSFRTHVKELPWTIARVRVKELHDKGHPLPWIRKSIGAEFGLTLK
jgi:hypothetical protein